MDDAVLRKADALLGLGRTDEALTLIGHALATEPDNAEALMVSARAQYLARRFPEALAAAGRAAALDPGNTRALRLLALAASTAGHGEVARESATRALHVDALDPENHAAASYVATQAGDHTNALECAVQAVRLAPEQAEHHVRLGSAAADRASTMRVTWRGADLRLAEQAFTEALRLDPQCHDARTGLARVRLLAGKAPEAAAHLADVLGQNPADADALHNVDVAVHAIATRMFALLWAAVFVYARALASVSSERAVGIVSLCAVITAGAFAARLVVQTVRHGGQRMGQYLRGRSGWLRTLLVSMSLGWAGMLAVTVVDATGLRTATGIASVVTAVALVVAGVALLASRSALSKRTSHVTESTPR